MRIGTWVLLGIFWMLSESAQSAIYIGGNYGYSTYSNPDLSEYKISPKGSTYGGFIGYGQNYLALEFLYQKFKTVGDLRHDGANHDLTADATVLGGAVRLSFEYFYLRGGIGSYQIRKEVKISDPTSLASAQDIYKIENETLKEAGFLYGAGIQKRIRAVWFFADLTIYEINSQGKFFTYSGGISFIIPDKAFSSAF